MDILSVLFHQRTRKIGVIIPDVVITETHTDEMVITQHPVEISSDVLSGYVMDHAYRQPSLVDMVVGFAAGGSLLDLGNTSSYGLSLGLSPKETYQQLLDLQRSRKPFDVITGKRTYSHMLIKKLVVTTDGTSEYSLKATLTLQEVIISRTNTLLVANKDDMQSGASTSAVQNTGNKSPIPATNAAVTAAK